MKILLTTDFHIGFRPKSHVTPRSAKLYEEMVYDIAVAASSYEADLKINLGDLFDKYSNSEEVILQGAHAVEGYEFVMSGNHDVRNIHGSTSSLELLSQMRPGVRFTHAGPEICQYAGNGFQFTACCHYFTQAEFEAAIRKACGMIRHNKLDMLLLHCNVGDGHGEEIVGDQSSLYLTSELQELVSERFDFVFVGHEHVRRKVKNNIFILGNHFPLSFGEMSDRWVHVLDTETKEIEKIKVFDVSRSYRQISAADLINSASELDLEGECYFLEVDGEIKPEERPELSKALVTVWKNNCYTLLALKNNVTISGGKGKAKKQSSSAMDFMAYLTQQVEQAGFEEELKEVQ